MAPTRGPADRPAEVFETDLDVWLVASGTAANALSLVVLRTAPSRLRGHIERDERAPLFSGGGKIALIGGDTARSIWRLKNPPRRQQAEFVHEPAHVLSMSPHHPAQPIRAETRNAPIAHRRPFVHVEASPMPWSPRVIRGDELAAGAISFGATKNGGVGCEAIILFGRAREKIGELRPGPSAPATAAQDALGVQMTPPKTAC
jgi:threonine aldolase